MLSDHLTAFIRMTKAKRLSVATQEWYQYLLSDYQAYVEEHGLVWHKPETLEDFLAHLVERGLSPYSVHDYYRALRRFFNWLEKRQKLPGPNPAQMIEAPRLPRRRLPKATSMAVVEKLLKAVDTSTRLGKRDLAVILFLADTGVRAKELCNLVLADLDLENRMATIRDGKGEKDRTVAFGRRAARALSEWLAVRGDLPLPHVFVSRSGAPLTTSGLRQVLYKYRDLAGVQSPVSPHRLRHGFATTYLNNGGKIHHLQHLMGLADIRTAEIYLHTTDDEARLDHEKASPVDNLNLKA